MANTTSGTHVFDKNFSIDEIIQEGYERIGMSGVSGYQLKSARRSLNIINRKILIKYMCAGSSISHLDSYLSINKVAASIFVIVETFIPPLNKIPSSGKFTEKTSPVGTSA